MDVEPFLRPRTQTRLTVRITDTDRAELRMLFGEELCGPHARDAGPLVNRDTLFFDYESPSVEAGEIFGREWTVVDTMFGRKYLVLVDKKGGFILLSLLCDDIDVMVEFDRPVPTDRPSRHDDDYDWVAHRNRLQYAEFMRIAANLLARQAHN